MGGGLFGTPLALNPKCLLFAGFVLTVYWMPHFKPLEHRIVMGFLLATVAYVLLAWYDVLYDCNDHLRPTILGWVSMPFKPKEYGDAYNQLPIKYQKLVRYVDIAVLVTMGVLFVIPFLVKSK
jgi:hypothetical protein